MTPIFVATSSVLILFIPIFLTLVLNVEAYDTNFITIVSAHKKTSSLNQKLSHLHFYFHDVVSGRNPTAVPVTKPNNQSSFFGEIMMIDDLLTSGPDPDSKPVGRAQGMYASASQSDIGLLQAMNLYFTEGKYNGSVLTVLGRNAPLRPVREMPVIGGSGLFRFATGYCLARTHWADMKTGDVIVEYNITVMHY